MMNFAQKLQKKRKDAGFSQKQLAFELNVSRQAVSKWESGQGYPEVEKLIQLSELLGVSLDELMKETSEAPLSESAEERIQENTWNDDAFDDFPSPAPQPEESLIGRFAYTSDRESVEKYLHLNQIFARKISGGVSLILCGVIPPILFDNDLGAAILMFFVAIGVGLLIKAGMDYQDVEKIEKQGFHLSGELICDLQDEYERFQKVFTARIVTGVGLIILGVGLMLILNGLFGEEEWHVITLFLCTAVGVGNFITAGIINGVYHKLLNIQD